MGDFFRIDHMLNRSLAVLAVLVSITFFTSFGRADEELKTEALALLASGEHTKIAEGIVKMAASDSDVTLPVLSALEADQLHLDQANTLLILGEDDTLLSAETLQPKAAQGTTSKISLNNQSRRTLQEALARIRLTHDEVEVRRSAARKLSEYPDEQGVALVRKLILTEPDSETKDWMALTIAKLDLSSPDPKARLAAAITIQHSSNISLEQELKALVGDNKGTEKDPRVREEMRAALRAVQRR